MNLSLVMAIAGFLAKIPAVIGDVQGVIARLSADTTLQAKLEDGLRAVVDVLEELVGVAPTFPAAVNPPPAQPAPPKTLTGG